MRPSMGHRDRPARALLYASGEARARHDRRGIELLALLCGGLLLGLAQPRELLASSLQQLALALQTLVLGRYGERVVRRPPALAPPTLSVAWLRASIAAAAASRAAC